MKRKLAVTADDVRAAKWAKTGEAGSGTQHVEFFSADVGGVLVKASKTTIKASGVKSAAYMVGGLPAASVDEVVALINGRMKS